MENKKGTVVVSGASGFLGTNTVGVLMEKGYKVAPLPRHLLLSPMPLESWLMEAKPDYIIHLAGYGNHYQQQDVDEIFTANVIKTYTLLRTAYKVNDFKLFINVSTSSVYGKKTKPMTEKDSLETDTFYGASKIAGEYLSRAFAVQGEKNVVNVRPFSVYGEGEGLHRLIPTIIRALVLDQPMKLYTKPTHDWVYVEDFINGLITLMNEPGYYTGESVNIGTGKQYTNKQVYEALLSSARKAYCDAVEFIEEGGREYDNNVWRADASKLKILDWKSEWSLERGLDKTFKYYKNFYEANQGDMDLSTAMNKSFEMLGLDGFK